MDHRNESRNLTQQEKAAIFDVAMRIATAKPDETASRVSARFAAALKHHGCKYYDQNGVKVPQWSPSAAEQIVNEAKRYGLIDGEPINEPM